MHCSHRCTCVCHRQQGVLHFAACCSACNLCGTNILPGFEEVHKQNCHAQSSDTTPTTKVFIEFNGRFESAKISQQTYLDLRRGLFFRRQSVTDFLRQVIAEYGSLTEENIRKFMEKNWERDS